MACEQATAAQSNCAAKRASVRAYLGERTLQPQEYIAATQAMRHSAAHTRGYGSLRASPSVFEENESCGDACARKLPSVEWIGNYDFSWLWNDVLGGITLGLVLLAQSLAHAHLCGVAPIRGPYACLLAPLAYALLGTCHGASIGTGGLMSLVVSEQLAREYATPEERSDRAATCALLVGLVLCLMGLLRLAFLVRFLSRPALSGFISGLALLIIKGMSGPMVGNDTHRPTALLSLACLAWLFAAKPLASAAPLVLKRVAEGAARFKALVALFASAVVVQTLAPGIAVVGSVPEGLPAIRIDLLSSPQRVENMLPGAVSVAIVVFVSSFATAKKCALHGGYHVEASKELWALGAANVASAACGGVPVQVGLSRSATAISLGVRSQVASLFSAGLIASVLYGGASLVERVPLCALSAIIAHAAWGLLELQSVTKLWNRRHLGAGRDCCVWAVAFVGTLLLGALWGCAVAVATSLLLVLQTVAAPNLSVLRVERAGSRAGEWRSSPALVSLDEETLCLVVRIEGQLWYANAERFHEQVEELELFNSRRGEAPLAVVLCASSISFVDATGLSVVEEMVASWKRRLVHFYVASSYGQPKALLEAALDVGDCSRTIDECLTAEAAARNATRRRRRSSSHDAALNRPDYWASRSSEDNDDAFKLGFHRSLPSFQTIGAATSAGAP